MINWVAKVVFPLIFGGCCNSYFWDIPLKMYRLTNFNMFFQFVLTTFPKVSCFCVYRKLITSSTNAKGLHVTLVIWYEFLASRTSSKKNLPAADNCLLPPLKINEKKHELLSRWDDSVTVLYKARGTGNCLSSALIWASQRDLRDDFNEGWIWIYNLI